MAWLSGFFVGKLKKERQIVRIAVFELILPNLKLTLFLQCFWHRRFKVYNHLHPRFLSKI